MHPCICTVSSGCTRQHLTRTRHALHSADVVCLKVTSFQERAIDVGSEIDFHRRVTEWLEETFMPKAVDAWPKVARHCRYLIHRRKAIREFLQNTILVVAVVINVVATVLHNDLKYQFWEQMVISFLSWVLVLLTAANFFGALCTYHNSRTFKQHGWIVRCCPSLSPDQRDWVAGKCACV